MPKSLPITLGIAEPVRIKGQSLIAMDEFLNPENNETNENSDWQMTSIMPGI